MRLTLLYEANRENLAKEIEDSGFEQQDVAKALGVHPSTVSRHTSDNPKTTRNPSFNTLKKYISILGAEVLQDLGITSKIDKQSTKRKSKTK